MNEPSDIRQHTETHGDRGLLKTAQAISKLRAIEKCIKLDVSNLTCKLCKVRFQDLDEIIDHLIQDHELKYIKGAFMFMRQYNLAQLMCPECTEIFVYSSFLIKHVDEVHNLWTVPCDFCNNEFTADEYLEAHKSEVHWDEDNTNAKIKHITTIVNMSNVTPFKECRGNRVFDCYSCLDSFTGFENLRIHHASQHNEFSMTSGYKPIVLKVDTADLACRECSESLDDIECLIEHLRLKHDVEIPNDVLGCVQQFEIDKTYSCRICKATFEKYWHLLRHINEQHVACPDILCSYCGLGFTSMSTYNRHRCKVNKKDTTNDNESNEIVNAQDHYEKWLEDKGINVVIKKKKLETAQENPNPIKGNDKNTSKAKKGNKRGRKRSANKR